MLVGKIVLMFLAKDHAAFDTARRKLAVWADIRHLQWGFAQRREYRRLQQHARNPAEEVVAIFYSEVLTQREFFQ